MSNETIDSAKIIDKNPLFKEHIDIFIAQHHKVNVASFPMDRLALGTMDHFIRTPSGIILSIQEGFKAYGDRYSLEQKALKKIKAFNALKDLFDFIDILPVELWELFKNFTKIANADFELMMQYLGAARNKFNNVKDLDPNKLNSWDQNALESLDKAIVSAELFGEIFKVSSVRTNQPA